MKLKISGLFLFSFLLWSCGGFKVTGGESLASASAVSGLNGAPIYQQDCAGCHGDLATSAKLGATAAEITQAIHTIPSMAFLSFLTQDQITAIANALDAPPTVLTAVTTAFPIRIGTRKFVASKLTEIFVANPSTDSNIASVISNLVSNQLVAFGGLCNQYDVLCIWGTTAGMVNGSLNYEYLYDTIPDEEVVAATAPMQPAANPLRSGYNQRYCEDILSIDKAVQNALAQVGLNSSSPGTAANIDKIVSLMFADRAIGTATMQSLTTVYSDAASTSSLDGWRFVMFAMCTSSMFEVM